MNLIFESLRWKNFMSTGNQWTEIDFLKTKTTLIVGPNGSGKSSMIDALFFAIYGKPYRNINKPLLINSINKKGMLVELNFRTGSCQYMIRRGMKPNVFEVYQDGTLINQNADSKEYQEVLESQIIGMSMGSFSQIVVLGTAAYIPFMDLPAGQRRLFVEDLLDNQIYSVMNTLNKEKAAANKMRIAEVNMQMNNLATSIQMLTDHIAELSRNKEEQIGFKQGQIDDLRVKQRRLDEELVELRSQLTQFTEIPDQNSLNEKRIQLITLLNQAVSKGKELEEDIRFYREHDNCPTCKQGIIHDFKHEMIQKKEHKQVELEQLIERTKKRVDDVIDNIAQVRQVSTKRDSINDRISNILFETQTNERLINSFLTEIEQLRAQSNVDNQKLKLKELKKELKDSTEEYRQLIEEKQLIDISSTLLKDTGIKARTIKKYIPLINKLINKYLAAMDFFVNFELNENFEETIRSRHRDEFTFNSFSEGEKARLNLAILFAWRNLAKLRNSAATNLLIMDEVFDGSLELKGVDNLVEILSSDVASESNIFTISHREVVMEMFDRTLRFEKVKNFTEYVEV